MRTNSCIHNSFEVLKPQLHPIAHLSCDLKTVSYQHFLCRYELQESLKSSISYKELDFAVQVDTAVFVPIVGARKDFNLSLFWVD